METRRKRRENPEDMIQPIPGNFENIIKALVRPVKSPWSRELREQGENQDMSHQRKAV